VLVLAVDKLSNKSETQVGAEHMCFVVCYVTFRAAYSVAVTFTVLLLLIRHFNRSFTFNNNDNSDDKFTILSQVAGWFRLCCNDGLFISNDITILFQANSTGLQCIVKRFLP